MLREAERLKKDDDAVVERVEARNELERVISFVREAAEQRASERIAEAAAAAAAWLDDAPMTTSPAEYNAKKTELETILMRREKK
jgi:molecular chaperone DnaK (HSP70)